jgi:hypothetical protein
MKTHQIERYARLSGGKTCAFAIIALFTILFWTAYSDDRTGVVLERKKSELIITINTKVTVIKSVYEPKENSIYEKWDPNKLLSPDKSFLLVPMQDYSYRLYSVKNNLLELEKIISGGTFSGVPRNYWRTRARWNFIGWDHTGAKLLGDVGPEGFVSALVNLQEETFKIESSSGEDSPLILNSLSPDGTVETRFLQVKQ